MNSFLPKRRKAPRMAHKEATVIRSASHLQFVRGHECCIKDKLAISPNGLNGHYHECEGNIEAMHVRTGTDGSMGKKPGDNWTIPGCSAAHRQQHQVGERAFERAYSIDMKAIASALWAKSPAGMKFRAAEAKSGTPS